MTLIDATIVPLGLDSVRCTWTGTAGATVRAFVNGRLVYGPKPVSTAAKSLDLSLPDPGTLEIHESTATETVPAMSVPLERRPLVWWSSAAGAARYEVYFGSTLVGSVLHEDGLRHHELRTLFDVRQDGGVWTTFHVEAISTAGVSTSTATGDFYAPGVLTAPSAVSVSGGSGTFNITVTP